MNAGVLIVGSGMAGVTLARELRKIDVNTDITLISADRGGFYSKPNISNALAAGKTADQLMMSQREALAAQLKIEIRAGDGASEVLSVNHLDDYAEFRRALDGKKHVALLGAGLIGCEFANDLRLGGFEVDVFDLAPQALGRLLPLQAATFFQQRLESAGVKFHFSTSIVSVVKSNARYLLHDNHGVLHQTDLVLSAIGLIPETGLARTAGLTTNRGIVVDLYQQANAGATDAPIYALGDCMEVGQLNLPFILPIMAQARALAKTLAGTPTELHYAAMPVVVKTPACPTVVCPPPAGAAGAWQETSSDNGVRALFLDNEDKPLGFALTGSAVTERQSLATQIPAWI